MNDLPSWLSTTDSRMLTGPTRLLLVSHPIAKWFRLYWKAPVFFQTPRQKLLVTGGREEFMVADEVNVYLWRQGFHLFFPMVKPRTGEGARSLRATTVVRHDFQHTQVHAFEAADVHRGGSYTLGVCARA